MVRAYTDLHEAGLAHSVEAWEGERLAGGVYGISMGQAFFGESMFTRAPNASKVAFVTLVRLLQAWNFALIDCQVTTGHLLRFGAKEIPRAVFLRRLSELVRRTSASPRGPWRLGAEDIHQS
jgi:leucyl/phenylalanyl-tRNA--protein transferase